MPRFHGVDIQPCRSRVGRSKAEANRKRNRPSYLSIDSSSLFSSPPLSPTNPNGKEENHVKPPPNASLEFSEFDFIPTTCTHGTQDDLHEERSVVDETTERFVTPSTKMEIQTIPESETRMDSSLVPSSLLHPPLNSSLLTCSSSSSTFSSLHPVTVAKSTNGIHPNILPTQQPPQKHQGKRFKKKKPMVHINPADVSSSTLDSVVLLPLESHKKEDDSIFDKTNVQPEHVETRVFPEMNQEFPVLSSVVLDGIDMQLEYNAENVQCDHSSIPMDYDLQQLQGNTGEEEQDHEQRQQETTMLPGKEEENEANELSPSQEQPQIISVQDDPNKKNDFEDSLENVVSPPITHCVEKQSPTLKENLVMSSSSATCTQANQLHGTSVSTLDRNDRISTSCASSSSTPPPLSTADIKSSILSRHELFMQCNEKVKIHPSKDSSLFTVHNGSHVSNPTAISHEFILLQILSNAMTNMVHKEYTAATESNDTYQIDHVGDEGRVVRSMVWENPDSFTIPMERKSTDIRPLSMNKGAVSLQTRSCMNAVEKPPSDLAELVTSTYLQTIQDDPEDDRMVDPNHEGNLIQLHLWNMIIHSIPCQQLLWEITIVNELLIRSKIPSTIPSEDQSYIPILIHRYLFHTHENIRITCYHERNESQDMVRKVDWMAQAWSQSDDSPAVEILGTLQDAFDLHLTYNCGPMPDAVVAFLLVEMIEILSFIHNNGITHNNLGLDSFLIVREVADKGKRKDWSLRLVGLGSEGSVLRFNDKTDMIGRGCDTGHDHLTDNGQQGEQKFFEIDLRGIANILHMLLFGGSHMSFSLSSSFNTDFGRSYLLRNKYVPNRLAWGEFFGAVMRMSHGFSTCFEPSLPSKRKRQEYHLSLDGECCKASLDVHQIISKIKLISSRNETMSFLNLLFTHESFERRVNFDKPRFTFPYHKDLGNKQSIESQNNRNTQQNTGVADVVVHHGHTTAILRHQDQETIVGKTMTDHCRTSHDSTRHTDTIASELDDLRHLVKTLNESLEVQAKTLLKVKHDRDRVMKKMLFKEKQYEDEIRTLRSQLSRYPSPPHTNIANSPSKFVKVNVLTNVSSNCSVDSSAVDPMDEGNENEVDILQRLDVNKVNPDRSNISTGIRMMKSLVYPLKTEERAKQETTLQTKAKLVDNLDARHKSYNTK